MFILKFFFYFIISFFILCVPYKERALFYHLHFRANPYITQIFSQIKKYGQEGIENCKKFGQKVFSNSVPRIDNVKSKYSSTKKGRKKSNLDLDLETDKPNDSYTVEEKELLKKILREASQ